MNASKYLFDCDFRYPVGAPKKTVGESAFANDVLPLLVRRADRIEMVRASTRLAQGDRLTLLVRGGGTALESLGVAPEARA